MNGQSNVLGNGIKLVGEAVVPGASQFLDGRVGRGLMHAAASAVALALLGPIGGMVSLALRVNSFSTSVGDRNLFQLAADAAETVARTASRVRPTPSADEAETEARTASRARPTPS
jgi:hypothetical protein